MHGSPRPSPALAISSRHTVQTRSSGGIGGLFEVAAATAAAAMAK